MNAMFDFTARLLEYMSSCQKVPGSVLSAIKYLQNFHNLCSDLNYGAQALLGLLHSTLHK